MQLKVAIITHAVRSKVIGATDSWAHRQTHVKPLTADIFCQLHFRIALKENLVNIAIKFSNYR
jgi:hypothetical protein